MNKYEYKIDSDFSLYDLEDGIAKILIDKNLTYTKNGLDINQTSFDITINESSIFNKTVYLKILVKIEDNHLIIEFSDNYDKFFNRISNFLCLSRIEKDTIRDIKNYVERVVHKEVYIDMNMRRRIIAATPIISLIIFLCMGYIFNMWGYGCIAFLLIPFMPIILGEIDLDVLYPVIVCVVYVSLGLGFGWWHPAWIMFLTIPVYYILFPAKYRKYLKSKYNYNN